MYNNFCPRIKVNQIKFQIQITINIFYGGNYFWQMKIPLKEEIMENDKCI